MVRIAASGAERQTGLGFAPLSGLVNAAGAAPLPPASIAFDLPLLQFRLHYLRTPTLR